MTFLPTVRMTTITDYWGDCRDVSLNFIPVAHSRSDLDTQAHCLGILLTRELSLHVCSSDRLVAARAPGDDKRPRGFVYHFIMQAIAIIHPHSGESEVSSIAML